MSFYVLSLTGPLTHSVIKFTSRVFAITSLALVYGLQLTPMTIVGILLAAFGSLSYTVSMYEFSPTAMHRIRYGVFMTLLFIVVCFNINWVTKDMHQLTHVFQKQPKNYGRKQSTFLPEIRERPVRKTLKTT